MKEPIKKFQIKTADILQVLVNPELEGKYPYLLPVVFSMLYLTGIILWWSFFDYGHTALTYRDWDEINVPRLVFLSQALRSLSFPWHMAYTAPLHGTDRFFSIPDVITSPQVFLLYFIKVRHFIYLDIVINYSIGVISIVWIKKLLKIALLPMVLFFFLFVFNGYIVAHFSEGHFTWLSHFLFPVFFGLMIILERGDTGWRWVASMAFLMFYIVLEGGEHQFVWLLLFMILMFPFHWKQAKWLLAAVVFSGLVSAVRLLPPVVELSNYAWATSAVPAGYPSVTSLIQAMIQMVRPGSVGDPLFIYRYHEFSLYTGVIGFLFICSFGIFLWIKDLEYKREFSRFIFPVILMIFLSLSDNYSLVKAIPFPMFSGERVSSRFIYVPYVFLLMMAVYYFQKWLNARERINVKYGVIFGAMLFIIHDLLRNLELWSVRNRAAISEFDYSKMSLVSNHPDPVYTSMFYAGLGITLVSMAILLFLAFRKKQIGKSVEGGRDLR